MQRLPLRRPLPKRLSALMGVGGRTRGPSRSVSLVSAYVVGATGFEPVTSSVSGHAWPFTGSVAASPGTMPALLRRDIEPGIAGRREAAQGIAADNLLTAGSELHSI